MVDRQITSPKGILIVVLMVLAVAAAAVVVLRTSAPRKQQSDVSAEFRFDAAGLQAIDPALVGYRETARFDTGIDRPHCIATGPDDAIYVGGRNALAVLAPDGQHIRTIPLAGKAQAVAVADDGGTYVAMLDHIEVFDAVGGVLAKWLAPDGKAALTAIAVKGGDVVACDYGRSVVLHYDTSGRLLGQLGARAGEDIGFVVPSPYFDLAFAPDGLLRIANPGRLRIEAWTLEGDREFFWGAGSTAGPKRGASRPETSDPADFVGCCNPSHIAILPDGRIATSEKGVARIKVYKQDRGFGQNGLLDCFVAGPEAFADQTAPADIATDSARRVVVLDTGSALQPRNTEVGASPTGSATSRQFQSCTEVADSPAGCVRIFEPVKKDQSP